MGQTLRRHSVLTKMIHRIPRAKARPAENGPFPVTVTLGNGARWELLYDQLSASTQDEFGMCRDLLMSFTRLSKPIFVFNPWSSHIPYRTSLTASVSHWSHSPHVHNCLSHGMYTEETKAIQRPQTSTIITTSTHRDSDYKRVPL